MALLSAVGTGAISAPGLMSSSPLIRFRADLSNETPMGSLPDGTPRLAARRGYDAWTHPVPQSCPEDMLLRNAEVQYVCRHAARQSHGRSNRGCCRLCWPLGPLEKVTAARNDLKFRRG